MSGGRNGSPTRLFFFFRRNILDPLGRAAAAPRPRSPLTGVDVGVLHEQTVTFFFLLGFHLGPGHLPCQLRRRRREKTRLAMTFTRPAGSGGRFRIGGPARPPEARGGTGTGDLRCDPLLQLSPPPVSLFVLRPLPPLSRPHTAPPLVCPSDPLVCPFCSCKQNGRRFPLPSEMSGISSPGPPPPPLFSDVTRFITCEIVYRIREPNGHRVHRVQTVTWGDGG